MLAGAGACQVSAPRGLVLWFLEIDRTISATQARETPIIADVRRAVVNFAQDPRAFRAKATTHKGRSQLPAFAAASRENGCHRDTITSHPSSRSCSTTRFPRQGRNLGVRICPFVSCTPTQGPPIAKRRYMSADTSDRSAATGLNSPRVSWMSIHSRVTVIRPAGRGRMTNRDRMAPRNSKRSRSIATQKGQMSGGSGRCHTYDSPRTA